MYLLKEVLYSTRRRPTSKNQAMESKT